MLSSGEPYCGTIRKAKREQRLKHSRVNISNLKGFAMTNLQAAPALRDLILSENDEMTVEEFLAKMDVWLKLFRREVS